MEVHVSPPANDTTLPTEVKKLKQLVRNVIDPDRHLGHIDRGNNERKPEAISDEAPSSMLSGRSFPEKAEQSGETSSKKPYKESRDSQERTTSMDTDATVARGAASEEYDQKKREERIEESPSGGDLCEDCK